MIHFRQESNDACGRELLRKLRDACLGPCGIDLTAGERVRLLGCLSSDHPVELGVRYGVERHDGELQVLDLRHRDGRLEVSLSTGLHDRNPPLRELALEIERDRFGRIAAPELGARLDLELRDEREIEHFLRRIVRALLEVR